LFLSFRLIAIPGDPATFPPGLHFGQFVLIRRSVCGSFTLPDTPGNAGEHQQEYDHQSIFISLYFTITGAAMRLTRLTTLIIGFNAGLQYPSTVAHRIAHNTGYGV
jgi:hypothetical protein